MRKGEGTAVFLREWRIRRYEGVKSRQTPFSDLHVFYGEIFGMGGSRETLEQRVLCLNTQHAYRKLFPLEHSLILNIDRKVDPSRAFVEIMSRSNTFLSRQGTLEKGDPAAVSGNGQSDQKSPTTKVPSQQNDVTKSNRIMAKPAPTDNKISVQGVGGASTSAGTKQNAYACEPCECRKLKCDGERPTCGNCGFSGRKCVYA